MVSWLNHGLARQNHSFAAHSIYGFVAKPWIGEAKPWFRIPILGFSSKTKDWRSKTLVLLLQHNQIMTLSYSRV